MSKAKLIEKAIDKLKNYLLLLDYMLELYISKNNVEMEENTEVEIRQINILIGQLERERKQLIGR